MGRGFGSKGKGEGGGPDWLRPPDEGGGGGGGGVAAAAAEKPKKPKKRRNDEDDLDTPEPKGVQWKPLAFLCLMILPGIAPVVVSVLDYANAHGFQMPGQSIFAPSPYRSCLAEFYADHAPEKLGGLDDTLFKYTGREKQLFGMLSKKYKQKANFARCVPPKESKPKEGKASKA